MTEVLWVVFLFLLPWPVLWVVTMVDWTKTEPRIPYGKVGIPPDERFMALGGLLIVAICLWFDR